MSLSAKMQVVLHLWSPNEIPKQDVSVFQIQFGVFEQDLCHLTSFTTRKGTPACRLFNTYTPAISLSISPRHIGRFVKTCSYMCTLALAQSIPGLEKSYSSLILLVFTLSAALLAENTDGGRLWLRKLLKKRSAMIKKQVARGSHKCNYQPALVT